MEIKKVSLKEVESVFSELKPDLLDEYATYYGCLLKNELVGVVSFVEHPKCIYLCHAFVKEEHRGKGIYKLLCDYRYSKVKDADKSIYAHCNVDSLKYFINNGFKIEKALFKVVKE